MLLAQDRWQVLTDTLARYDLTLRSVAPGRDIPGSYWGAPEAGLGKRVVYARGDTPVHSVLHESAHCICMTQARRETLDTDAGGDDQEESAVCYLQILLARPVYAESIAMVCADMDAWGYSFRLGNARAWFEGDADDARAFLREHGLIDNTDTPTYRLRS
jgi:elongation factor P hydroxylase